MTQKKFNAKLSFSPLAPYEQIIAERVPLIEALKIAVQNYQFNIRRKFDADSPESMVNKKQTQQYFNAVECGVYTGSSLIACAQLLEHTEIDFKFLGLDTFNGLPDLSENDLRYTPENAIYKDTQLFNDTSLTNVNAKIQKLNLDRCITLIAGLFSKTLIKLKEEKYNFINIDCDLYEPHMECLNYFYSRVDKGGVIYFDDYYSVEFPMARKAIDVFLKDKPEELFHFRYGVDKPNHTKAFLIKYE